jgi:type 1 glutamine amidotransferase
MRFGDSLQVLLVTRGHPFVRDPFFAIFEGMEGIAATHVEHPAAQRFFNPEAARDWDAYVHYDMPGIEFAPGGPRFHDPPKAYVEGFLELLDAGHGFVFLHHAIAGWPTWDEYAEILGGRFLYVPGEVRGRALPDSGYRHDVSHRVRPVADHPVLAGLDDGFAIEDELYLFCPFEDDVTPLLRSDFGFTAENFYSAANVVQRGKMFSNEGWSHPAGSDLIAWTHRHRGSPIVYIACGDGPNAYGNPALQRLVANAIRWVAADAKLGRAPKD